MAWETDDDRRDRPRRARRHPFGCEASVDAADFRVWAPGPKVVGLRLAGRDLEMEREAGGYWSLRVPGDWRGRSYGYLVDGDVLPDPASRFQPEGPTGLSEVIDPTYAWSDAGWAGLARKGVVVEEIHVGTFSREGTWRGAIPHLRHLADIGINAVEVMPVAEFPGRFGWGYDGVLWWAPFHLYGRPDDVRAFVDAAHAHGIGVLLDVVYNHFGGTGNPMPRFAPGFLRAGSTEWGDGPAFDGPDRDDVRAFVISNAAYWIEEFHLDGLRLDATQSMPDTSDRHVVAELVAAARAAARWPIVVAAENEPQQAEALLDPAEGGWGIDAMWNDDFHHSAVAALTGQREAYYSETCGRPQEFVSALRWGFLYQGQVYTWQKGRRGSPALGFGADRFVHFVENHDQVANSLTGCRLHEETSPGRMRAITAVLLLGPATPLLFQGQEFASSSPFQYFADNPPELAEVVRRGRETFLGQFPSLATPEARARNPDPGDVDTFVRCKLDWDVVSRRGPVLALHRNLLAIRRADPTIRRQDNARLHGAVLGAASWLIRMLGETPSEDRLLVVNLGIAATLRPAPEPLLAPPRGLRWVVLWSSEDPAYGGMGTPPIETLEGWHLPAESALLFHPTEDADELHANGHRDAP